MLAAAVATLTLSTPLAGQTPSGRIMGTVADKSGAVLPGVTATLTSPALQVAQRVQVTDAAGEYQFLELPIGEFQVRFELAGFGTLVREGIQLTAGFAAQVNVTLEIAQLAESLTVAGGSPLVDLTSTRGGATISQTQLQAIPITNNYQDIVNVTPGMVVTAPPPVGDIALAGSFRNYGGAAGQQRTYVDGLEMRDNDVPNFNALEEVDAKTYGNTAEVPTPGAVFNLIVKSGGNAFHGRIAELFMSDRFQATNIDKALQAQGLQSGNALVFFQDLSGDLGGRIVPDKWWFYGAYRDQHNKRTLTGFVAAPGPDQIYGTADDVPGKPAIDNWSRTLKTSYQATTSHRFVGMYVRDRRNAESAQNTADRFTPLESTIDFDYLNYQNKAEWQGTFTDHLFATVMYGTAGSRSVYDHHSTEPTTYDLTTLQNRGETWNLFDMNERFDRRRQVNGSVSYLPKRSFGGSHELKVGGNLWWNTFLIDVGDRPAGNYRVIFDRGVATQFQALNNPLHTDSRAYDFGTYITDTWRVTNRLTLNIGIRADRHRIFAAAVAKPQGAFGESGSYPQVDVAQWSAWGPRIGGAFDLFGNAKTVVKGTYGRYTYLINEYFSAVYSGASQTTTTYRWRDTNGNNRYDAGEVNLAVNGPDFLSITGNVIRSPNQFNLPFVDEVTASLERELTSSLSARALWVYKRTNDLNQNVNAARPYDVYNVAVPRVDPGPDGITGTGDDGGEVTLFDYAPAYRGNQFVLNQYATRSNAYDDYANSMEFNLSKRGAGKFSGMASFLATKNHRWLVGMPQSPNDLFFPLDTTWDTTFRLNGSYRAPYGVSVSAVLLALSGTRGQRTYLFRNLPQSGTLTVPLEPFGAEEGPVRSNLNLRAAKSIALSKGRRIDLAIDVMNVLNDNSAWTQSWAAGPTFGYVTSIATPRIAQFGATFSF
jgi:hypothetical protein